MDTLTIFGLQFVLSLTVFGLIAKWFVAPWIAEKPHYLALTILALPHAFRHLGLAFLVPGLTEDTLPREFANFTAYGDFVSGLLAIVVLVALRNNWRFAVPLVWVFNIVGVADLVNALSRASAIPHLGVTWFIPTFVVPVLIVTHVMVFSRLFKHAWRRVEVQITDFADPV